MQFTVLDNRSEGNSSQIPVVEGQTVGKYRLGNMSNFEEILVFAEELIYGKIGNYFSDLQR
nr:hypothetical protein [Pleurocapsa sp. MO_226.B13]